MNRVDVPWEEDIFVDGSVTAVTRAEIEALNDEKVHAETTLAVLYAPWCPFCQAMVGGFEEAAAALVPKGVKVVKFRADGDEKEWSKETLSLASFPTILLFPKGRTGYVKLGGSVHVHSFCSFAQLGKEGFQLNVHLPGDLCVYIYTWLFMHASLSQTHVHVVARDAKLTSRGLTRGMIERP